MAKKYLKNNPAHDTQKNSLFQKMMYPKLNGLYEDVCPRIVGDHYHASRQNLAYGTFYSGTNF